MTRSAPRRGYALIIVIAFTMLLFSLSALVFRQLGTALRIEKARAAQTLRDEGSVPALARALRLLQSGSPPSDPYRCGVTIETSLGPRDYTVTMSSDDVTHWTIQVAPTQAGDTPDPMPSDFAPPGE
jgi:hypothetical protein